MVVGIAVLVPALRHGGAIGPYSALALFGPGARHGTAVHGYLQGGDQGFLFIPWTTLAWQQVHAGHLPLWNPYSALGMPLAFNWESAVFSPQAVLGYLVPLHLAYTASFVSSMVLAGTGVYVLCRTLRIGVLGAAMAGTVFELSGAFVSLLAWPVGGVMCWAGWLFAAAVWIVRGRHRLRSVCAFAVVLGCAGLAGQPEALLVLGMALAMFLAGGLAVQAWTQRARALPLRAVVDLAVASVAGAALFLPLALPGLQVAGASVRKKWQPVDGIAQSEVFTPGHHVARALSFHDLSHVIFSRFDGFPVGGGAWFGDRAIYFDSAAYVGVVAITLAVMAIAVRRRSPVVVGFGVLVLGCAALAFFQPAVAVADAVPGLGGLLWNRALVPLGFGLAVLAGFGADLLVRRSAEPGVRRALAGATAALAVVVGAVWILGRGHLPTVAAQVRARSFAWPVVGLVLLAASAVALSAVHRPRSRVSAPVRGRTGAIAAAALTITEALFLVTAGAPLWSADGPGLKPTPQDAALARAAGSSLVALGARDCVFPPALGFRPNLNVAYHVHELAVYDPMTPLAYFTSWTRQTGAPAGYLAPNIYCPAVTSVAQAHAYGVGLILEPAGTVGPPGTVFVGSVASQGMYRVPGAAAATLVAPGSSPSAARTAVAVKHPGPSEWSLTAHASTPSVLRLRLADVPGWRATMDGRPLSLRGFDGIMLQASVPPGTHRIDLRYWPPAFSIGIALALCSVLGMTGASVWVAVRKRRTGGPVAPADGRRARVAPAGTGRAHRPEPVESGSAP
ncbi:MAG TPA: YfhO family protein [Acidimicrobiales bacterium]|nr:YfhO family protein [Acidimicrobiales bacterium]